MSKAVKAAKAVEHVAGHTAEKVEHLHPVVAVEKAASKVHPVSAVERVAKGVKPVKSVRKLGKFVPNAVSKRAGRTGLVLAKNSPSLLFGVGVVGIVGTAVLASRATLKLEAVLDEHEANKEKAAQALQLDVPSYGVKDYNRDLTVNLAKTTGKIVKLYGPTVILGVATVTALAGSHTMLTRRNAGLTAAYATVSNSLEEYRRRVQSEVGEDKERELFYDVRDHVITEDVVGKDGKVTKKTKTVKRADGVGASPYARFFDEFTRNWKSDPELNHFFIACQQRWANDMLQSRGHVFLNEVYDMLGIDRSTAGQRVGWFLTPDGDNYIDFGLYNSDNPKARDFVNGREGSILLDFNVDGDVHGLLDELRNNDK